MTYKDYTMYTAGDVAKILYAAIQNYKKYRKTNYLKYLFNSQGHYKKIIKSKYAGIIPGYINQYCHVLNVNKNEFINDVVKEI